jgi:tetratricopeptide (TPR) repeat protein
MLSLAAALFLAAPVGPALAEGITRIKGKVVDNHGKPLEKVKIRFEGVDINKKLTPLLTKKDGSYLYATLDVSIVRQWRIIPELPGYKAVKVSYEIVDSEGAQVDKRDVLVSSKQDNFPDLKFALVGDLGRNVVDFVMAKEAEYNAALDEERRKRGDTVASGAAPAGATAPGAAGAPAGAGAPPAVVAGGKEMLEQAKAFTDAGRHEEAVKLYQSYLAKDPTGNPAVYYYLGKSLYEMNDDGGAEQALRKGLELKPDMKGGHFYLGNIALRGERAADAAAEYEKELQFSPDSSNVYFKLGEAEYKAGEPDKALGALDKSATLDPSKPDPLMLMAAIYEEKKDPVKRDEMYERIKAVDPKNAAILFYNIGAKAQNQNRPKEAVQAFRKSIEIDPAYPASHRQLGYTLMATQDFPGALKAFQEYLKLDPKAPDAKEIQESIALLK